MDLDQRVILLTGAGSGIGRALAQRLAAAGASLVLAGRNAQALASLQGELPAPVEHRVVVADITTAEGRAAIVHACERLPRPLDALINNAGINCFGLFADLGAADIARLLDTNLGAPILLTHALLPGLLTRPTALVVNVGSAFGSIGFPGFATYSAGKFGLRGFSEALRRELADSAVRVLYVAPRATRTALNAGVVDDLNRVLKTAVDSPARVADEIVAAMRRERARTHIGWPEKAFARLNALLPGVVDRALAGQLPVIVRHARAAMGDHAR